MARRAWATFCIHCFITLWCAVQSAFANGSMPRGEAELGNLGKPPKGILLIPLLPSPRIALVSGQTEVDVKGPCSKHTPP